MPKPRAIFMQPLSRNRLGRFLLRGENGCDTPPHNFCIKLVWWYSAPPMTAQSGGKGAEHDRGYFGWIKFEAPVSAALQLDRALSASQEIMRSVLFQTVREETRARLKTATIREVKRSDVLRAAPRAEEVSAPVSEEDLDKAISEITSD